MYNSSASFDSIYIVESLPDGELKTGMEVFERAIRPAVFSEDGFVCEVYQPRTKGDFLRTLHHVQQLAEKHGRAPVLQLDAHGSPAGLLLHSGERLTWEELIPLLTRLNQTSRMNLVVLAAMCNGWYLSDILKPTDRSPAFAIIGSRDTIPAGVLLDFLTRFYTTFLKPPHDLRSALNSANLTERLEDWTFEWIGAELLLCRVFQYYMDNIDGEEPHDLRVNRLVAEIARARQLDLNGTRELRLTISADLRDYKKWFNHYRTHFLMLDLYPDNEPRFPLTFEDCGHSPA
jgi:hypothetical protein